MAVQVIVHLFISSLVAYSVASPSPPNIKTTTSIPHLNLSLPIHNFTSHDLSFPSDIKDDQTFLAIHELSITYLLNKIQNISMQQSPEEVAELKSEVRLLREEGRQSQQLMRTALETLLTMQGHMDEMQQEQQQQQKQLNSTIVLQHEQGRQTELEKEKIWEALGTLNQTINKQTPSAADYNYISFEDLVRNGRIHLEMNSKAWYDARTNCQAMGGDLFVAGDLAGANQYWREHGDGADVWVGMRGRTWINGRRVASHEWGPGEPDHSVDSCGYLPSTAGYTGVRDWSPCSHPEPSMCQK